MLNDFQGNRCQHDSHTVMKQVAIFPRHYSSKNDKEWLESRAKTFQPLFLFGKQLNHLIFLMASALFFSNNLYNMEQLKQLL